MKTPLIVIAALSTLAIPAIAAAETAVIEATVTKAGKRAPIAALTLDVAADGSTSEARASGPDSVFEVSVQRTPRSRNKTRNAQLRFEVELNRGKNGRFKLRSARTIRPGKRHVIGAFRRASGEVLEIAVTTRP